MRSFQSGCALDRRPRRPPPASAGRRRGGSPRARRPRSERRSWLRWLRTTCGPKSRSGRARLRSWQTAPAGRARSPPAGTWYSRASATSGLRASGWTLVASTTVSRPRASRLRGDEVQHVEGVVVAAWSFSSSETSPRQKSDDRTSVGLKCAARTSTCRSRTAPIRTTSDEFGDRERQSFIGVNTAICVGAPTSASSAPTGTKRTRVAEARGDAPSPSAWNSARVHSKRWSRWRNSPGRQRLRTARCTRRSASSRRPSPGRAYSKSTRSKARQPRRVEVLDHLDDGGRVEAREPRVAVDQRAVQQPDALALRRRQPVELQPRRARSPARGATTSTPDDLGRTGGRASSARSSLPSPQPRSSTRVAPRRLQRRRRPRRAAAR